MSFSAFLMGEDSFGGGENKMSELSGGENVIGPLLEIWEKDIVAGRDNSTFVDAANQLDNDLLASVVIDDLKLTDVVVLLHDSQEFNENF